MSAKTINITQVMIAKGVRMKTWATSKGLSDQDKELLYALSSGRCKGLRGRSKKLREMLEKESFYIGDLHE